MSRPVDVRLRDKPATPRERDFSNADYDRGVPFLILAGEGSFYFDRPSPGEVTDRVRSAQLQGAVIDVVLTKDNGAREQVVTINGSALAWFEVRS